MFKLILILTFVFFHGCSSRENNQECTSFIGASQGQRPMSWNSIQHIVVVFLENTAYLDAIKQPFHAKLAQLGGLLINSYALSRPSQPNYIGFTSGDSFGVATNDPISLNVTNLADLLDGVNKSWKLYAESYPGNCDLTPIIGAYAKKHVPFLSYDNITSQPSRCAKITHEVDFDSDIANGTLPEFSLFIPNNTSNGHDTGVAYADSWLKTKFENILANSQLMANTLFIFTYDEGTDPTAGDKNHIYTVFVGAGVQPGSTENACINHYGVLATIEEILQLGNLGRNDERANKVFKIWK